MANNTTKIPFQANARIVAYLRDSGHEDQELSIEQQEVRIRAWCQENGLLLTKCFVDAAAPGSSTIGRVAFHEMIQNFRTPGCQDAGIVVWKFNRFARDLDDAAFYKADLRRRGFIIHSLNDAIPEGLDGRFFEAAVDWMNARYLDDLRTDIKRGLRHLVDQYGALGGTPPRGFKREAVQIGERRDGRPHIVHRWVPDPEMVPVIRQAFEMRAADASYNDIKKATHLFKATNYFGHFFANRIYIGELEFADQVIQDYCEAIIDRDLWETVQAVQARHANAVRRSEDHPRRKRSTFLLSGLVFCARCGSVMNADVVVFRKTQNYRYEYYACTGAKRNECTARNVPRALLENTILENLAEIVLDPDVIAARHRQLVEEAAQADANFKAEQARLKRDLKDTRRRIDNITETIADKGRAARALLAKLDDLEREETELKTRQAALKPITRVVPSLEDLQRQGRRLREILAMADPAEISSLLHATIDKITVELDVDAKKILGIMHYYEPPELNDDRASYNALYEGESYDLTQCPRRDISYTHKYSLPFSIDLPSKSRSRF